MRCVDERVVVHPLWRGCGAVTGIDVDSVARVLRKHGTIAFRQLARIFVHIRFGNGKEWLLLRKEIRAWISALIGGRNGRKSPGPFRDGSVCVAGTLSSERRQIGFESRR